MYIKNYAKVRGVKTLKYLAGALIISAILFACGSVATRNKFYQPVRDFIKKQNYDAAAQLLDEERNRFGKKDRLLYYLDSGFAHHYAANLDTSNARLTLAENTAEELFTKSVTRGAASMVLNDNTLEYAGEDYEVLYSNLFKAINYSWKDKFDDVYVEIRRALLKLELLEQKYARANQNFHENKDEDDIDIDYEVEKVRFNNDAFARYLSMHVFAADGRWDDARIAREYLDDAFKSQPHIYYFDKPDVKYFSEDKAVLSVVGMAGPSPVKEALSLRLRTDDELDLIQVLYDSGPNKDAEYGHIPFPVKESFYVKFSLPKIVQRPSEIHSISLKIGEYSYGELELLEDVGVVAEETFKAKKSLIYFRTIIRAVGKGIAGYHAKKELKGSSGNSLLNFLIDAGVDLVTDLTENADLRCSRLLPGKIYVKDVEIEPGIYDIEVQFLNHYGNPIARQIVRQYEVVKGGLNLIAFYDLN